MPSVSGLLPPRAPRVQRWICHNHATDVFRYMFYSADDSLYGLHLREVDTSRPAAWVKTVFPEGQTEFYTKGLSKFEKASSVSRFRSSMTVPNFSTCKDFEPPSCGLMLILGTKDSNGNSFGQLLQKNDIESANRRWNEGYGEVDLVNHPEKRGKTVKFPMYSPVTRVHHLVTYETACRLIRRDRTWEICCMDRIRECGSPDDDDEDEVEVTKTSVADEYQMPEDKNKDSQEEIQPSAGSARVYPTSEVIETIADGTIEENHKKRRRRRRRRRSSNSYLLQQNFSACFEKISLFIDELRPTLYEPNPSNRIVDEFCF